jgi:RND family efflux transporter MFP subunit
MKTKLLISIMATMLVILNSCSKKQVDNSVAEKAVCVQADTIIETATSIKINCSGMLSSKRISKLSFKTGGIVNRILVEEGSVVKKGQLLATLDMTEISAQVQQAKVAFEKANRDLQRAKNLFADSVITLEQLQNATSAYDAALENKNIAEFNQRYSSITAPANGKIIGKMAEESELTGPGMPVLIFSAQGQDEWIVKTGISDKDLVAIKKGDRAVVKLDAFQGKEFKAEVSKLAEVADQTSGTFEIELAIKPENAPFINGMVASISIQSSTIQRLSLLPSDAITEANGNKGFVYMVDTNKQTAKKIPVTIAYIQNNEIAVIEQISKLGRVITKGAAYLENGSRINITN